MSGCIPYRRRPPPVRNMRAVLKKASYGTRRVFRSPPCSKQASVVQKGYSVPETPFSGTEQAMYGVRPPDVPTEAEERGSGSEIGDFAKNGHLYAPVTAATQSQSAMDYLELPLNSCRQLWAATKPLQTTANRHKIATKPLQIAADCHRLPQTAANSAKLSQAATSYSQTTAEPPGPLPCSRKLRRGVSVNRLSNSMIIFVRTKI